MTGTDPNVMRFLLLYRKVRAIVDDNVDEIKRVAASDTKFHDLCSALRGAAELLEGGHKRSRQAFAAPVDPQFLEVWRDYEHRYRGPLDALAASELDALLRELFGDGDSPDVRLGPQRVESPA